MWDGAVGAYERGSGERGARQGRGRSGARPRQDWGGAFALQEAGVLAGVSDVIDVAQAGHLLGVLE